MTRIEIDPIKLGELEVGWWRAHNEKDVQKMVRLLIEQNVALYGFTQEEAQEALQHLVEKGKYHDTKDWNGAVDAVTNYYSKVKNKTGLSFDTREVAELEVGWWRLHDELEDNPDKTDLAKAFAKLYATLFGVDTEKMTKVGQLKAEATREHDLAEAPNVPLNEAENHWSQAHKLLVDFYLELKRALAIDSSK